MLHRMQKYINNPYSRALGIVAIVSCAYALAVYARSLSFYPEQRFIHVFGWQLLGWLPAAFIFAKIWTLGLPTREKPAPSIAALGFLRALALSFLYGLGMTVWYVLVSSQTSPYVGLDDTEYGVFRWFFISWFFQQILAYWAVTGLALFWRYVAKADAFPEEELKAEGDNRYFIRSGTALKKINPSDIIWIGAQDYYTVIHTTKDTYWVKDRMTVFEAELPKDQFLRIHRSTIVNLSALKRIERDAEGLMWACLKGDVKRRVSRSKWKTLQDTLKSFT